MQDVKGRCGPCATPARLPVSSGDTDFYEWVPGAECTFACHNASSPPYYNWEHSTEGHVCLQDTVSPCATGQYPRRSDSGIACAPCEYPGLADQLKEFAAHGELDKPASCPVQCRSGYYDDFGTCRQIDDTLTCPDGFFKRAPTATSDAICQRCSGCEGMRTETACREDADTQCAECGVYPGVPEQYWPNPLRQHAQYVDPECEQECLPGFTQLWFPQTSHKLTVPTEWKCEDCSAATPCPAGTERAEHPLDCDSCVNCTAPPANALFTTGCLWRCPSGHHIAESGDGSLSCEMAERSFPSVLLPAEAAPPPPTQCDPGMKLVHTPDGFECTACTEATPLPTVPATWQWRITPCDQVESPGWECVGGLVSHQEFASLGIDAPLPECIEPAERSRRLRIGRLTDDNLAFSALPRMQNEAMVDPALIGALAGVGALALLVCVCLACRVQPEVIPRAGPVRAVAFGP